MNKKTVSSETGYIAPVLRTHIVKVEGIICESGDGYNSVYHTENFGVDEEEDI